ncbi:ribonuclease PH [Candidatus Kinetoplastibacterium oncopeltii TCC290E]|uniref:Ribonuclease PH n=1 Tax=Candidatus Kinetoplastidibacterium stringomonadis TCC290E TaxID=1208920 RepID=M1LS05_9PROT|nr:ribonuclease PH [Candidatus Kinetoplastibacterium oncopeltii]AGF48312.1 ribonuclease PH [Candidatus Kinetoplastibacterium oncopeltii TCC290E]
MNFNRTLNRSFNQLRNFEIIRNFTNQAAGSVLVKAGNTYVLCNASIVENVPDFVRKQVHCGWVTAEYSMLPCATKIRSNRESVFGKQTGRSQEIQRFIGRSIRSMFDLKLLGARTIHFDCDVIQADGGTRCASITGSCVAAFDAVNYLLDNNFINKNPICNHIAAISIGKSGSELLLDMDYLEDCNCDVDMNVVMDSQGKFVEVQATGEKSLLSRNDINAMLDLAEEGISKLINIQKECFS